MLALLLLLLSLASASAAELAVGSGAAAPGAAVMLPVSLSAGATGIAVLQFDLLYDSASLAVAPAIAAGPRGAGKRLYLADLAPGRRRFLLMGLDRRTLPAGALLDLFVTVAPAAAGALPLKLQKVVAGDPDGKPVALAALDGAVSVQGASGSFPRLLPSGVLNGASLLPSPVAPGGLVTLMGAGIGPDPPRLPDAAPAATSLGGVSVLFDGTPAPLLYAASGQINLVAPFAIQDSTRIQVTRDGAPLAEVQVPVAPAAPAILTLDGSGAGPAAVLNQNMLVNSALDPAGKGSVIVVFAAGAGQTSPAGLDGQVAGFPAPLPLLPVSARIAGLDAQVLYAGAAPGMIAGVLQVNCVVPPAAPSGYAVPLEISVANFVSQPGVTVAIQ